MLCSNDRFGRMFFALALTALSVTFVANHSYATVVGAQADGDDLAGASITVTYGGGGTHTEPILAGAPGQGVVAAPGFFDFSVTGDTFVSEWMLTNLNDDFILLVEFDLSGSNSLFDSGIGLNTFNGFAGRAGAVQTNVGAPTIVNSFESNLWPDAMNVGGDEYLEETIEYLNQDFRLGETSTWRDDTDIIGIDTGPESPEPASIVMALIAILGLVGRRRR